MTWLIYVVGGLFCISIGVIIGVTLASQKMYKQESSMAKRGAEALNLASTSARITREHLSNFYEWVDLEFSSSVLLMFKSHPIVETIGLSARLDENKLLTLLEPVVTDVKKLLLRRLEKLQQDMEDQKIAELQAKLKELKNA